MSQRGTKRKIRDAERELAYLDRLREGIVALRGSAGTEWNALRDELDAYETMLDKRAVTVEECIRDLQGQMRKPLRRRVRFLAVTS